MRFNISTTKAGTELMARRILLNVKEEEEKKRSHILRENCHTFCGAQFTDMGLSFFEVPFPLWILVGYGTMRAPNSGSR